MKLKYLILLSLSGSMIALDQLTKQIVMHRFHLNESLEVIAGYFNLTYVHNPGAAFGILARADSGFRIPFFIAVPILALGVIGYLFHKINDKDRLMATALSLVIGGAFGNLIDRATYNYVIDFLDFHWRYQIHFPTFNVADIAICVGVGLLILDMFKKTASEAKH